MISKKALLTYLFGFILTISTYCPGYTNRGTDFLHETDPILKVTGEKSSVIKEKLDCKNKDIEVYVTWYSQYNQGIFTINVPKDMVYEEGMVENIFYETIETWIKDSNHRYYSYTITKRNVFFSRKMSNDKKCVSTEIKVNFLK